MSEHECQERRECQLSDFGWLDKWIIGPWLRNASPRQVVGEKAAVCAPFELFPFWKWLLPVSVVPSEAVVSKMEITDFSSNS